MASWPRAVCSNEGERGKYCQWNCPKQGDYYLHMTTSKLSQSHKKSYLLVAHAADGPPDHASRALEVEGPAVRVGVVAKLAEVRVLDLVADELL